MEPTSASSNTDLPLAKAEPISDSGSISGIADLRSREKSFQCLLFQAYQAMTSSDLNLVIRMHRK